MYEYIDSIKFVPQLADEKWVMTLAFIVDLTISRNELNMKLQWKGELLWKMFSQGEGLWSEIELAAQTPVQKMLTTLSCQIIFISSSSQSHWQTLKYKFGGIIQ